MCFMCLFVLNFLPWESSEMNDDRVFSQVSSVLDNNLHCAFDYCYRLLCVEIVEYLRIRRSMTVSL